MKVKINSLYARKFWTFLGVVFGVLIISGSAIAGAVTTISQGYTTTDSVTTGSIVSLKDNSNDEVEAANSGNANNILGVVVNDGGSLIALSNTNKTQQIQVATSGVVQVLVSDLNGGVSAGDQITASPINGIGMKATDSSKVIGTAQGDLNNTTGSTQSLPDKNGQKHSVMLGQIPLVVNVAYYYKQPQKTIVPSAIQNVANALAGKTAQPLPIIISLAIFIIAMVTISILIFTMVRSSIISVGRNPMAQSAVYRNLIQISIIIPIILGVAFGSIYLILSRF